MPQQNGHSEQLIQTLSDKAESMYFNACLSKSQWNFAFHYRCYIYNQTLQARLNWQTLFKLLEKEKPKVDNLQVFGCRVYIHIPQVVYKDKMSPKSELMTYISITSEEHGNIFIYSSRNIVFTVIHTNLNKKLFSHYCTKNRQQQSLPDNDNQLPLLL